MMPDTSKLALVPYEIRDAVRGIATMLQAKCTHIFRCGNITPHELKLLYAYRSFVFDYIRYVRPKWAHLEIRVLWLRSMLEKLESEQVDYGETRVFRNMCNIYNTHCKTIPLYPKQAEIFVPDWMPWKSPTNLAQEA